MRVECFFARSKGGFSAKAFAFQAARNAGSTMIANEAGYLWAAKHVITLEDNCTDRSQSSLEGCYAWVEDHGQDDVQASAPIGAFSGNPNASLWIWFANDKGDASKFRHVDEHQTQSRVRVLVGKHSPALSASQDQHAF